MASLTGQDSTGQSRLTASQLAGLPIGWDIQNALFQSLGGFQGTTSPGLMADYMTGGGGANEAGQMMSMGATPNWDALNPYTFNWAAGPKNSGQLTAYGNDGNVAGQWAQKPEQSLLGSLGEWGALAAAGFGGAGLLGLGPLAGAFGGLGAADFGSGAGLGGVGDAGGAGLLGEGSGVITGGSGLTAPALANGSGLGAGLGTAGAGGAGGGGLWGGMLKTLAPVLGSVAGGLIQSNAAGKAANAQTAAAQNAAAAIQKALQPYQQAGTGSLSAQQDLLGINGADKQQAAIQAIQASPAFTSQQKLGENRILANASATGGLRGGNVQAALAQFSPALMSQLIDQQYTRLNGLTGLGANAAAGVGTAQANAQTQIGSAQAGQALANGSALQGAFSGGFGALGQYLGNQTPIFRQGGGF